MIKIDRLTTIRLCIKNNINAIKELEYHLEQLKLMEKEELEKIEKEQKR